MFREENTKRMRFKAVAVCLAGIFVFSAIFPTNAQAARSGAGGGKLDDIDWGQVGLSAGIAVGGAVLGSALSNSMQASSQAMNSANTTTQVVDTTQQTAQLAEQSAEQANMLTQLAETVGNSAKSIFVDTPLAAGNLIMNPQYFVSGTQKALETANLVHTMASGYNTMVAVSQVSRAVGMMGSYYDWDPSVTFWVSTVASCATSGFLNSEAALGRQLDKPTTFYTNDPTAESLNSNSLNAATANDPNVLFKYSADPEQAAQSAANYANLMDTGSPSVTVTNLSGGSTEIARTQVPVGSFNSSVGMRSITATPSTYVESGFSQAQTGAMQVTLNMPTATAAASNNLVIAAVPAQFGSISLGNMLRGAAVGGLGGFVSGWVTTSIDRDKIDNNEDPGAWAQIAGMATGDMAANFGRTLVNPATYHTRTEAFVERSPRKTPVQPDQTLPGQSFEDYPNPRNPDIYGEQPGLATRSDYLDTKYDYKVIDHVNYGQESGGAIQYGVAIEDFERGHLSDNYRIEQIGENQFKITELNAKVTAPEVFCKLGSGAFLEPFNSQNWPLMASRAMGIWAQSSLGEDDAHMATLVNGLVQSATYPTFSGIANVYGVDAVRYFGSHNDKLEADLRYDNGIRLMAEQQLMAGKAKRFDETRKQQEANNITFEQAQQQYTDASVYRGGIETSDLSDERQGTADLLRDLDQGKIDYAEFSQRMHEMRQQNPGADFALVNPTGLDKPQNMSTEQIGTQIAKVTPIPDNPMEKEQLSRQTLPESASNARLDKSMTWAKIDRNLALAQESKRYEQLLSSDRFTQDQALKNVGMNKGQLLWNYAAGATVPGVFDSLISGGVDAVFSFQTKGEDFKSTDKMLYSYAANLTTAIVRGAAQYSNWDRVTKEYDWHKKWDFVMPEQYTTSVHDKGFDFIQYKLSEANFENDMLRFKRFVGINGFEEGNGLIYHRERQKWDFEADNGKGGKGAWVNDPRWVATIQENPYNPELSLQESVASSINQANVEMITKTFSFGMPTIRHQGSADYGIEPERISASDFMSYSSNSLRNVAGTLAQGGLGEAIAYSFNQANTLSVIPNNLGGTLVQLPGVAKTIGLQPERLVRLSTIRSFREPVITATLNDTLSIKAAERSSDWFAHGERTMAAEPEVYRVGGEHLHDSSVEPGGYEPVITFNMQHKETVSADETVIAPYLDAQRALAITENRSLQIETGIQDYYQVTNIPKIPYALESARFEIGLGAPMTITRYWLPYPNPLYGIRPQTGEGDFLRRKGPSGE